MVDALCKELTLKSPGWQNEKIRTIYFGGGTPSLLSAIQLNQILSTISNQYHTAEQLEITLEANPDDISHDYLTSIFEAGINRLSVGIQTFDNDRLKFINRVHDSNEAKNALTLIKQSDFDNYSIDLIYAIPPDDLEYWVNDLKSTLSFDPPHISLYGLTIEEQTVFGNWKKKGKIREVDESEASQEYRYAIQTLKTAGYEHYEVSNFAKSGYESRHNNAYWSGQSYLGIGPGAHSYRGNQRMYNVSNNPKYIKVISEGQIPQTIENLSRTDQINEYLFTRLRTRKGLNFQELKLTFGVDLWSEYHFLLEDLSERGMIRVKDGQLTLTSEGFMLADEITYRMFYED